MSNANSHYIRTHSHQQAVHHLVQTITQALFEGKRVLWLLSGGSVIPIAVAAAKEIRSTTHGDRLTIMQVDERYGLTGHTESNWQKLAKAGFDCKPARYEPILRGLPFTQTVATYKALLIQAMETSDLRVGLFGIGVDGHTAGMLPGSAAAKETELMVVGYHGTDYDRITITTPAIAEMDLAIAYTAGLEKLPAVERLRDAELPIPKQPAQALKQARELYVYNDTGEST
jgi:6-phosphogluconolactonase/glucosamine-6-phosphate isomerase/deaminase